MGIGPTVKRAAILTATQVRFNFRNMKMFYFDVFREFKMTNKTFCYRPLTKLREDNVFTPVCHSVHECVCVCVCVCGECVGGG